MSAAVVLALAAPLPLVGFGIAFALLLPALAAVAGDRLLRRGYRRRRTPGGVRDSSPRRR